MPGDRPTPDSKYQRFLEAYAEHRSALFRQVREILPLHDAEEVVHDTFLHLWLYPERYDPKRGTLRTYLRLVARGKSLDLLRAQRARSRRDTIWSRLTPADAVEFAVDGTREEMRDAIGGLSAAQREAIVIAFYGGATYREVADRLGVAEGTIKTRIRTGLSTLREELCTSDEAGGEHKS